MGKSFTISIDMTESLTVGQIWPDGDAPENPTVEDVEKVFFASGDVHQTAEDWGFRIQKHDVMISDDSELQAQFERDKQRAEERRRLMAEGDPWVVHREGLVYREANVMHIKDESEAEPMPQLTAEDWKCAIRQSTRRRLIAGEIKPVDVFDLRRFLRIDAEPFAKALGVSAATLVRLEDGTEQPSPPVLNLIRLAASRPSVFRQVMVG